MISVCDDSSPQDMARVDFPQQAYYTALGVSMTKEKQDHLHEPARSLGWFDMPNWGYKVQIRKPDVPIPFLFFLNWNHHLILNQLHWVRFEALVFERRTKTCLSAI